MLDAESVGAEACIFSTAEIKVDGFVIGDEEVVDVILGAKGREADAKSREIAVRSDIDHGNLHLLACDEIKPPGIEGKVRERLGVVDESKFFESFDGEMSLGKGVVQDLNVMSDVAF